MSKIASDAFLKKHNCLTRDEEIKQFGEAIVKVAYVCDGCKDEVASIKMQGGRHLCFKCHDKKEAVINFIGLLEEEGDMFFSCGDTNKDYQLIKETIKAQGYWAGNKLRYYFDKEDRLIRTEERRFGE